MMGSSVVNALSSFFTAEVAANGKLYQVKFTKGEYVQRQKAIKDINPKEHGTTIKYHLDDEMFTDGITLDSEKVLEMCQQMAFLNNGLKINVAIQNEDGTPHAKSFCYTDGLKSYLELLIKGKKMAMDDRIHLSKNIPAKELPRDLDFDISFSYSTGYAQETVSFVNSIPTEDGGSHVQGFYQGICNAVRKYGVETKAIKQTKDFEIGDTNRGIIGIVAMRYKKPTFDRQSKTKLDMPKVRTIIAHAIEDEFYDYLEKNPKVAKVILDKAMLARKERIAIKNKRAEIRGFKKNNERTMTLGKLADCSSKKPEECELWIVEGDSAGGSAKEARDRKTQAILPIFGKIKNTIKSDTTDILKNDKLGLVFAALRCGVDNVFDADKLRYDKIMLFSDADSDGWHIITLYIGLFWKHAPQLIMDGHVYIPTPPLFRATKKNEKDRWYYSAAELKTARLDSSWEISRFKGLGEMQPEQLWTTSMNPETRKLRRVTVEDAELAENMVETCLGSEVAPRRELILEKASFAV